MEYIFTYIANYGFPMVVASFCYFAWINIWLI